MTNDELQQRFREVCKEELPLPGHGETARRHFRLLKIGREDLSLARLAEAHFDAVAILAEAGRIPEPGATYGVWASERPGFHLTLTTQGDEVLVNGTKMFCSGASIIDRALVTVEASEPILLDIDLHSNQNALDIDSSAWKPKAFALTNTATVAFREARVPRDRAVGGPGWYLSRPGFWHGAIGPASCWAGGALGLLDYVQSQTRNDPHTLAHKGAMEAAAWTMRAALEASGNEIDGDPGNAAAAHARALIVRHVIEQRCTEILDRFGRAYGPHPFAFVDETSLRCEELKIYLRQCHAERDLAVLGALSK